jgi:hypothetical protein
MRQDRKRLSTRATDSAAHPNPLVPVVVGGAEPPSMTDDRVIPAKWAPPWQQAQRYHPGSLLSFVSGSEIKRITAGVKAYRDRPCQVSICWPGLHPPGKHSFGRKKEYSLDRRLRTPPLTALAGFKST